MGNIQFMSICNNLCIEGVNLLSNTNSEMFNTNAKTHERSIVIFFARTYYKSHKMPPQKKAKLITSNNYPKILLQPAWTQKHSIDALMLLLTGLTTNFISAPYLPNNIE